MKTNLNNYSLFNHRKELLKNFINDNNFNKIKKSIIKNLHHYDHLIYRIFSIDDITQMQLLVIADYEKFFNVQLMTAYMQ